MKSAHCGSNLKQPPVDERGEYRMLGSKVPLLHIACDLITSLECLLWAMLLRLSPTPPTRRLLSVFFLSEGFLMTNLSGLASLPISHYGIQLPPHPLMNSSSSKDRADRGEDRWKAQKLTSQPSFTFQGSTPPASSKAGFFLLFLPLLTSSVIPCFRWLRQLN